MSWAAKPELGTLGIFREALKLPSRNLKLLNSVVLLFIIPCFLMVKVSELCISPLMGDFYFLSYFVPTAAIAEIKDDFRHLREIEPVSYILGQLITVNIISLSAMIYVGVPLTTREFISRIGRNWKRVITTLLYTELFKYAYTSIISVASIYVGLLESFSLVSALASLLASMALFVGLVPGLYLELACKVSLLILMLEQDCYGLIALRKAWDLIKGKKLQAFILISVFLFLEELSSMVLGLDKRREREEITVVRVLIEAFVVVPALIMVDLFEGFVLAVFYHECKRNHVLESVSINL